MSSPPHRPRVRALPFAIADDLVLPSTHVSVPEGHFLSHTHQPRSQANPANPPPGWHDTARPDTTSLAAADYDVSVRTGFLPPEEPVQSLIGTGYGWDELELALEEGRGEIRLIGGEAVGKLSEAWRQRVRDIKPASLDALETLPQIRRAHLVLSFLGHMYIHSAWPALTVIPASISRTWQQVSDRLGVPPVLNYADTVLWNWHYIDPELGLRPDNVAITTTFTSTPSEEAFFLLSLFCELLAPQILRLMSATLDEAFFSDSIALLRIAANLYQLAGLAAQLTATMDAAVKGQFRDGPRPASIVPEEFYWWIRPWFNGGTWDYEGHGIEQWGGPSAGQSSLVHAMDLFLAVDHSPRTEAAHPPASSSAASTSTLTAPNLHAPMKATKTPVGQATDDTFMSRMSSYMPGPHRSFLAHLAALGSQSRTLALAHPNEGVGQAYNAAVRAMKDFRDSHFRLVARFIIAPARHEPGRDSVFWAGWEEQKLKKEVERLRALEGQVAERGEAKALVGTGGTNLAQFLKACRERTEEAIIDIAQA